MRCRDFPRRSNARRGYSSIFYAGNRGSFVGEEGFDAAGKRVWSEAVRRGGYSRGTHFIFAPASYTEQLFDVFGILAKRMHDVMFQKRKPVYLDSIQHQLFAAEKTTYPEMVVAHLGMAFEALVDISVAQHGNYDNLAVKPQKEFDHRFQPVYDATDALCGISACPKGAQGSRERGERSKHRAKANYLFGTRSFSGPGRTSNWLCFGCATEMIHLAHLPKARLPGGCNRWRPRRVRFAIFSSKHICGSWIFRGDA